MNTQREVPATEATPTPSHTDAAQTLVEEIRGMRQQIPNFVIPASKNANQRLATVAALPPQFVEVSALAVTNNAALVRGGGGDPARTRDLMSFAESYAGVADELEALASFVRHSVNTARNEAGNEALTTYALAKRLAKRAATSDLAPYVADMRQALGKRFRHSKSQPAPAPAPQGPAQPHVTPSSPAAAPSSLK